MAIITRPSRLSERRVRRQKVVVIAIVSSLVIYLVASFHYSSLLRFDEQPASWDLLLSSALGYDSSKQAKPGDDNQDKQVLVPASVYEKEKERFQDPPEIESILNADNKDQHVNPLLQVTKEVDVPSSHTKETDPKPPLMYDDDDCPFRNSSIYRKVYVYPSMGDKEYAGDMLSHRRSTTLPPWPWLEIQRQSQLNGTSHYDRRGQHIQYSTELLVRELMLNPRSCLRTNNPDEAELFWVPYLPSVEHHKGCIRCQPDMSTSPYGQAILDILDNKGFDGWETTFGLTSKYWQRRNGSDHILVFSEPLHGLFHPRNRRGSYHYVRSQKQLTPPIVISVELSTSFVEKYPKCTAKNILVPYPNTDGDWFNGVYDRETKEILTQMNITTLTSPAALPSEQQLARDGKGDFARPASMFYRAGSHGSCTKLRNAMGADYNRCSKSASIFHNQKSKNFMHGMRLSTFCPAPGGDSPSAKRMYDCLFAGSIPVILSHDFVWPFTNEFSKEIDLNPLEFSVRLNASDFEQGRLNLTTCEQLNETLPSLENVLAKIPPSEIERLRRGVTQARDLYSWYKSHPNLVENPLRENVLPDGGLAHAVVKALEERAAGKRWPACKEELENLSDLSNPQEFKC